MNFFPRGRDARERTDSPSTVADTDALFPSTARIKLARYARVAARSRAGRFRAYAWRIWNRRAKWVQITSRAHGDDGVTFKQIPK